MVLNFDSYAQKGHEFVNHVARELKTKDISYSVTATQCVLHALRNRLTVEESFQMMAQLPMAIKAVYVDGWKFNKPYQRIKHVEDFLDEVQGEFGNFMATPFLNPEEARKAVEAVFKTIAHYVSADEMNDVLGVLPAELKNWLRVGIVA